MELILSCVLVHYHLLISALVITMHSSSLYTCFMKHCTQFITHFTGIFRPLRSYFDKFIPSDFLVMFNCSLCVSFFVKHKEKQKSDWWSQIPLLNHVWL